MSADGIVAYRQRIKDAVTTVTGVTGYLYPPTVWKPGDCWPQWGGAGQPEGGPYAQTYTHAYRVLMVLPADPEAADRWVDAHLNDLLEAVAAILSVQEIQPLKLPAEGSQAAYNGLVIIGETE